MNVLFLCSSNIFRSQMAEGFFNQMTKIHKAESAALIRPQDKMHKLVVSTMKEEGIDISDNKSKKVSESMLKKAEIVIFMNKNLEEHLKNIQENLKNNVKIEFWEIPDVIAKETDYHLYKDFVNAREVIKTKITNLIERINKKEI